jgi:predicted secreted Zn-dependent protease
MTIGHVTWHKSSYSNGGGACVEVADLGTTRAVRDSKNPTGPALQFTAAEWSAFTTGVRVGEFD